MQQAGGQILPPISCWSGENRSLESAQPENDMERSERISLSKYLSYLLRHDPKSLDLQMDPHGWVRISELVEKDRAEGRDLDRDRILEVMEAGDKKRFRVSDDGRYIRASYGHSVEVDLQLEPREPPRMLFHGTAEHNLDAIRREGLRPRGRRYVHLSTGEEDARQVGSRHGKAVILEIRAGAMHERGHVLYRSDTEPGIWLTDRVPPDYISR